MSNGLLNLGTRALLVNQTALQTVGNNIANVNTPGYSRQSVVTQAVPGQYTGGGYVGKGVELITTQRAHSDFLTRQVQLTSSVASADKARASLMLSLEDLFPSGSAGIGSSVNSMLNAFTDVASSPADMTARQVLLQRADEMATRFRDLSAQFDDLAYGTKQQLQESVTAVNSIATRIASLNGQIQRAASSGQSPNDLLDARDQLVTELNGYVQTSTLTEKDGSLTVFIGSQPLVQSTRTSTLALGSDDFGDPTRLKLAMNNSGLLTRIDENTLAGGSVAGLMKFNNSDLQTARNLIGRMALALEDTVNTQHRLGVDLNGNTGTDFFVAQSVPDALPATANTGNATIGATVADPSAMVASDYEVRVGTAGAVQVIRLSDGVTSNFSGLPATVDGLTLNVDSGTAAAGDRFLLKPFSAAAGLLKTAFTSASALAVANPVQAQAGTGNTGTLTVQAVAAASPDANLTQPVTLTFTSAGTFDVTGTGTGNPTGVTYTPGQTISYNGWEVTLKGTPKPGDTITVGAANPAYRSKDGGNASALLAIRDQAMFDGATVADGYAGAMSAIGTLSQGAQYASSVSASVANKAVADNASVSGVNLDEEASKLLQYQQAYQASAKMIQIAQSIFDSLISGIGR